MTATYEMNWRYKFRVNAPRSIRQRIGAAMRRVADWVDQRTSLALEIETAPPISSKECTACVKFGVEQMRWAVEESARAASIEKVLLFKTKASHGTPS